MAAPCDCFCHPLNISGPTTCFCRCWKRENTKSYAEASRARPVPGRFPSSDMEVIDLTIEVRPNWRRSNAQANSELVDLTADEGLLFTPRERVEIEISDDDDVDEATGEEEVEEESVAVLPKQSRATPKSPSVSQNSQFANAKASGSGASSAGPRPTVEALRGNIAFSSDRGAAKPPPPRPPPTYLSGTRKPQTLGGDDALVSRSLSSPPPGIAPSPKSKRKEFRMPKPLSFDYDFDAKSTSSSSLSTVDTQIQEPSSQILNTLKISQAEAKVLLESVHSSPQPTSSPTRPQKESLEVQPQLSVSRLEPKDSSQSNMGDSDSNHRENEAASSQSPSQRKMTPSISQDVSQSTPSTFKLRDSPEYIACPTNAKVQHLVTYRPSYLAASQITTHSKTTTRPDFTVSSSKFNASEMKKASSTSEDVSRSTLSRSDLRATPTQVAPMPNTTDANAKMQENTPLKLDNGSRVHTTQKLPLPRVQLSRPTLKRMRSPPAASQTTTHSEDTGRPDIMLSPPKANKTVVPPPAHMFDAGRASSVASKNVSNVARKTSTFKPRELPHRSAPKKQTPSDVTQEPSPSLVVKQLVEVMAPPQSVDKTLEPPAKLAEPVQTPQVLQGKGIEELRLEKPQVPLVSEAIKNLWAYHSAQLQLQHREQVKKLIRRARLLDEKLLRQQAVKQPEIKADPNAWYRTMKPINKVIPNKTAKGKGKVEEVEEVDTRTITQILDPNGTKPVTTTFSCPVTRVQPEALRVPAYISYVGLNRSILSESNDRLLTHPLPQVEIESEERQLARELPKLYRLALDRRPIKLLHDHHRSHFTTHVNKFLKALGLSEEDVLYWIFDNASSERSPDREAIKKLLIESHKDNWKLLPNPKMLRPQPAHLSKWVFNKLHKPSIEKMAYITLVCATLGCFGDKKTGYNWWEHFRRSPILVELLRSPVTGPLTAANASLMNGASSRSRLGICRICFRISCEQHGQILPSYHMDYTPSAEDFEDLYISDYEGFRIKNTKKLIQPVIQRKNYIADSRKGKSKREGYDKDRLLDQRKPFQPCDHDGPCSKALGCPCAVMEISCEKYCGCPKGCERRFRGCACASRGKPCSGKSCRCLDNNRECDPDLCGECGVIEVLGPMNRNAEPEFLAKRCRNCYIQRGIPKRTLMGTSSIHGFGLFMGEDIQAEEFIGEYKGELLASSEGERRGNIDWYRHLSYLFALNHEQDIDSMKYGNKMRFINEPPPDDPGKQNCYPKTYLCNTVLRLGLFALRDLKVGEELYFSYGERFAYKQSKEAQSPVKKGRGKAVAVQSKKSAKKSNTGKSIAGSSSRGTPSIATHSRATSQSSTIPPSETSFPRSGRRAQSLRELVPVHTDQEVNEAFGGEVALEPEFYEKDPEDDSDFQIDEDTVMGEVESSEHGVSSEMDAKVQVSPVKSPRKRRRAGGHCS